MSSLIFLSFCRVMNQQVEVTSETVHPLSSAPFRWLWLGQAISTFGDRFTTIAIPLFIYELTGSSRQLGVAFVTQVTASLLFGLVAGAYSDRWDKRWTMFSADLLRAGLVALIPLSFLLGLSTTAQVLVIYLLSFVIAAIGQFFTPAKMSLIPDTVEKESLVVANSLDHGTANFMQFVGYSLAGIVIHFTSVSTAFWLDVATFTASALCIYMIRPNSSTPTSNPSKQAPSSEPIFHSIQAGLEKLWTTPSLRWLLILSFIAPASIGAIQPIVVIFVETVLQAGEIGYGFWQGAIAIGIAVGTIAIGRYFPHVKRSNYISLGTIGFGVFHLISILVPAVLKENTDLSGMTLLVLALPFVVLTAFANGSIVLGIRTIVQENTPPDMIGRVFGAVGVVASLAMVVGLLSAELIDRVGIVPMIGFWSAVMIVSGVIAHTIQVEETSLAAAD